MSFFPTSDIGYDKKLCIRGRSDRNSELCAVWHAQIKNDKSTDVVLKIFDLDRNEDVLEACQVGPPVLHRGHWRSREHFALT